MAKKKFVPMFRRAKNVPKGSRCVYCGGWAQIVEHVIPSLKPYDLKWNERYACSVCNLIKSNRQSRAIEPEKVIELLERKPVLHYWLSKVPVGLEAGDDDGYYWYYNWFRPAFWSQDTKDGDILTNIALCLYEADIPIRESIARYKEIDQ